MIAMVDAESGESIGIIAESVPPRCCWYFDPSYNRFVALVLICATGLLYSATYDMPASLESVIEKTFSIQPYQFEYLYSVYSFPNIVLCFFSGLLMDRVFGVRLGAILFSSIALFGQFIITVGGFAHLYWMMLVGRFLYGTGMESVGLTANCFSVIWFKGKELNFIFGLNQSLTRAGSSLAFLIASPIHSFFEGMVPEGAVLGFTITPCLIMMVLQVLLLVVLGNLSLRNGKEVVLSGASQGEGTVNFRQILHFPLIFWLIAFLLSICNAAVFSFISCSQQLIATKYNVTASEANTLSSLFNIFGAVISPVPGFLVDKIGWDLTFNFFGLLLGIASQVIIATTSWNPYIPLIIFSVFFSMLNSCAWPLVSRVVEHYQLATAYGTTACMLNLIMTISNVLAGYLLGRFGPVAPTILFLTFLIVGLICGIFVWILDSRGNRTLNISARQRKAQSLIIKEDNSTEELQVKR